MKVEKIIIKKELMEIPDHSRRMEFYKLKGQPFLLEPQDFPAYVDFETETYQVVNIHDHKGGLRRYLVKVDERGLFEELIEITDMFIKTKINEAIHVAMESATRMELKRIARLPWWKRLLNRLD